MRTPLPFIASGSALRKNSLTQSGTSIVARAPTAPAGMITARRQSSSHRKEKSEENTKCSKTGSSSNSLLKLDEVSLDSVKERHQNTLTHIHQRKTSLVDANGSSFQRRSSDVSEEEGIDLEVYISTMRESEHDLERIYTTRITESQHRETEINNSELVDLESISQKQLSQTAAVEPNDSDTQKLQNREKNEVEHVRVNSNRPPSADSIEDPKASKKLQKNVK